ncbi:CTP synthase [Gammaproteobacteria bacterium]|nr:CTP synthase [Gammaproteobacteria bacterium]
MEFNLRYVFVTGGVVSSLGKGVACASIGALMESSKVKVSLQKLDPYLNLDPGTMNPFEHGEVFVTQDGAETDLDLGHYERFVSHKLNQSNNLTCGRVYQSVLEKERRGDYQGATVQVIPHITNEIKDAIKRVAVTDGLAIVEIGGTVGDIESLPFLEAIRQMRLELGPERTLFIHLTLVPYIDVSEEFKTKPTQHSVKELRSIGIQPDILICRSNQEIDVDQKKKIALFTNVQFDDVVSLPDVSSIYQVPMLLAKQKLDDRICTKLDVKKVSRDLSRWDTINQLEAARKGVVHIGLIGKYTDYVDAYKSLVESLKHASLHVGKVVKVHYIDADTLTADNVQQQLAKMDGCLVPGGFGERGMHGKLQAIAYARSNNKVFLGICLGMHLAIIDFARHVAQISKANSTEFDENTPDPVVDLAQSWLCNRKGKQVRSIGGQMGGTLRVGLQKAEVTNHTLLSKIYGQSFIEERHRHRYEVNPKYIDQFNQLGLLVGARSSAEGLIECVELKDHPWFIGCQYHPEFESTPWQPNPLIKAFVQAASSTKK